MAINKDWMTEAATEIAAGIVLDAEITNSRDGIRSIILKHSPFKPDVAYMPVPRCETCKHAWTGVYSNALACNGVPQDGDMLAVEKDFGCVRWEEP